MKIEIYSTPTCPYCVQAKEYFRRKKLDFVDYDVSVDHAKAAEMVKLSGRMGVPVIIIDGKIIDGFDQAEIEKIIL